MRTLVPALLMTALLAAGPSRAQEIDLGGGTDRPVRRDSIGTILVNGATPYTLGARKLEVLFTHRFQQAIQDGDSHNLWGLDSGADVGIGLAWGAAPRLDLSLYRASFQEDFELAGKLLAFEQSSRVPLTMAARAGVDHLGRPGVEDSTRPFVQLLLARKIAPGVNLLVSPSWVRDTPRLRNAFNVPVGLTLPLPGEDLLVEIEYIPANRDLDDSRDAWHVALSKKVGGHIFEVVLGDSRASTVDQMIGGDFAGGFKTRDVRLGFNIVRDFSYGQ
jgi:hypothetical protein